MSKVWHSNELTDSLLLCLFFVGYEFRGNKKCHFWLCLNKFLNNSISLVNEYKLQQMLYALYNIQLMRPVFHLYALKLNSRPVYDAFLKTLDLKKYLSISNGNSNLHAKKVKFWTSFNKGNRFLKMLDIH